MAPEEAYTTARSQEGSFPPWPYYVLCTENTLRRTRGSGEARKSGARDEGTCPFFFFRTSLFSFVLSLRETGNGCQLSATRKSYTAGHVRILSRERIRDDALSRVWSFGEWSFIGIRVQLKTHCVHKYSIDWHLYLCTCLNFAVEIRE